MAIYFLLLDADIFQQQIKPGLIASWRQRSFAPCRDLCSAVRARSVAFVERYRLGADEPLLAVVAEGNLPFDRMLWQHLAGELLWYGAAEIPEIATSPEALACLLPHPRTRHALYGARDLVFGGLHYRPDEAGWNDLADVAAIVDFFDTACPEDWKPETLAHLPGMDEETEQAEELEFVRETFADLVNLYRQAHVAGQVVISERLT